MKTKPPRKPRRFDAFISHASVDSKFATHVVDALADHGLKAWIDHAEVRFGALLRASLQAAIRESRVLVLHWSKAASRSRWVLAELFTALHSGRSIVPCVLDRTPLPQFLQNTAWLDRRRDRATLGEKLCAAIGSASQRGFEIAPFLAGTNPEADAAVTSVARKQMAEMDALLVNRSRALQLHRALVAEVKAMEKAFPFEPLVLSAAGYHRKNAYLVNHWDALQAGQAPKDPVLLQAELYFFKVLCFKPLDPSSLNGLGSVLFLERELDAAEFFVRRALALAHGRYREAEEDLQRILYFQARELGRDAGYPAPPAHISR